MLTGNKILPQHTAKPDLHERLQAYKSLSAIPLFSAVKKMKSVFQHNTQRNIQLHAKVSPHIVNTSSSRSCIFCSIF